jgi:hypothetical protein
VFVFRDPVPWQSLNERKPVTMGVAFATEFAMHASIVLIFAKAFPTRGLRDRWPHDDL